MLSVALALVLGLLSLGLSRSEWRTAGHAAGVAARISVSAGGGAVGVLSRGAGGVGSASGWLVNLVNRGPGLEPEAPPPAAPVRAAPVMREAPSRTEPDQGGGSSGRGGGWFGERKRRRRRSRKPQQQILPLQEVGWTFPSLGLLKDPPPRSSGPDPARRRCRRMQGCWRRCCRIMAFRARSSRFVPAPW